MWLFSSPHGDSLKVPELPNFKLLLVLFNTNNPFLSKAKCLVWLGTKKTHYIAVPALKKYDVAGERNQRRVNDDNKGCDTREDKEILATGSCITGITQGLLREIHNK